MHECLNCQCEINSKYRTDEFCCNECADMYRIIEEIEGE